MIQFNFYLMINNKIMNLMYKKQNNKILKQINKYYKYKINKVVIYK